jgi:lysyl-tRNA synthetase class 2
MPDGLVLRRHPDAAALVERRAKLLAALRAWLDARGLLEADVPALLPVAGQEPHLHPPPVAVDGLPGPLWLQTSPELTLKRLVAAGVPRVYALGPAYRGGPEELSRLHQPQFTLLEWYRPGDSVRVLIEDVLGLGAAAATALGVAPPGPPRVLSLVEAFRELAGVPLEPLLEGDVAAFQAAAARAGLEGGGPGDLPETAFGRVLAGRIEPALAATPGWTFLHGFPACAAALARLDPADPRVALRVEAYLGGVEIANGWVELDDPAEIRRRWEHERRQRDGAPPAWDEALLAELAARPWPPTVGMALGVDRLMLALTGATALDAVLPLSLARGPQVRL